MNIIKELWHGNITPQDVRNGLASLRASSRNNSSKMKQLMEYVASKKQLSVVFCAAKPPKQRLLSRTK